LKLDMPALDNRLIDGGKVVSLTPKNIPGTYFC
jgi:hypothetical protein